MQGIGRHPFEYVKQRIEQQLLALNTLLDGSRFLTADSPSEADCYLFATVELVRITCGLTTLALTALLMLRVSAHAQRSAGHKACRPWAALCRRATRDHLTQVRFAHVQGVSKSPDGNDLPASLQAVNDMVQAQPNILAFHKRLRDELWPDGSTTHWQQKLGDS